MLAGLGARVRMTGRRRATRRLVGSAALAAGALAALVAAGPAAGAPTPHYQSGTDTATFTVTGVLDRNCLVSTGGSEVYIKPGDAIKFNSSLAGVDVGGLNIGSGSLAGLDVNADIDSGKSSHRSVNVDGGKSVTVDGLSKGEHTLTWTATGVPVASGLLGGGLVTLPLSSSQLQSGAKLSWSGEIYVTNSASQCKFAVLTPSAGVSLGPVHVDVPSLGGGVPGASLPKSKTSKSDNAPAKSGGGSKTTNKAGSKTTNKAAANGLVASVPGLTVPQQVVPAGHGGLPVSSGGGSGGYAGIGGGYAIGPDGSRIKLAGVPNSGSSNQSGDSSQIELASSNPDSGSGQMPVLLAIMAIIALALVAGTYARMFLLRKS